MPRKVYLAGLCCLALVTLITYHSVLGLNFYGDDYSFLEAAGRMSPGDYLRFYFDPIAQTGWYRPVQGVLFGIEWLAFGSNPMGYHAVNLAIHLCNALLIFVLIARLRRFTRIGFLSSLIWLGLPLFGVAVFWPGDADFLLTFFYLLAVLFWIAFLQTKLRRWQIISIVALLFALTTKEFGVTIPITYFLLDRFVIGDHDVSIPVLIKRYIPFVPVYAMYIPLELYIQSRSVLTNIYGYGISSHVIENFAGYISGLAFPWLLPVPWNNIATVIIVAALIGYSFVRKTAAPLALALVAIIAFAPAALFPWFFFRYLYGAVMISSIFYASMVNWFVKRFSSRGIPVLVAGVISLIIAADGIGVASGVSDFAELGRQTRVPFRDFTQQHPILQPDTYIYFIRPPTITSQLSGMFFLRFGPSIHVAGDEWAMRANLREHQTAYAIYFEADKRTREIAVEKNLATAGNLSIPVDFGIARLTGWEIASGRATRGSSVIVMLYWDAPIDANVELVNASTGQVIAREDGPSRGPVTDARVLAISESAPIGTHRVEVSAQESGTKLVLSPIEIVE